MWPLTVMELTFGASMLSLLADVITRNRPRARRLAPPGIVLAAIVGSLVSLGAEWGPSISGTTLQPVPDPVSSLFVVDRFTTFIAFTALVITLVACAYSLGYFMASDRPAPFYALLSALLCSLVGVVSAGDYLVLFLFWEGMSISAYGLVSIGKRGLSMEASLKYFFMAGIGSLLALYGMGAIYSVAGTLHITAAAIVASSTAPFGELGLILLVVGLGVEAAIVPLHTWLPDVYSAAPLPVASVVSGAVTGTGVFAVLKVVQPLVPAGGIALPAIAGVQDLQVALALFALLTMSVGNLSAIAQGNLRRMLSFSSVAQTGYMLAALSTLSTAGLVAVVFTIWNHGLIKSNFFMLMGRKNESQEGSDLESMEGSGRSDRRFGFLVFASSLAMMGSPPFGLFWSEILVVQSLLLASSTLFYVLAAAVVLNVVVSIGYYFRVVNTVVFGEPKKGRESAKAADLLPSALLLALSLATGIAPFLILGQVL